MPKENAIFITLESFKKKKQSKNLKRCNQQKKKTKAGAAVPVWPRSQSSWGGHTAGAGLSSARPAPRGPPGGRWGTPAVLWCGWGRRGHVHSSPGDKTRHTHKYGCSYMLFYLFLSLVSWRPHQQLGNVTDASQDWRLTILYASTQENELADHDFCLNSDLYAQNRLIDTVRMVRLTCLKRKRMKGTWFKSDMIGAYSQTEGKYHEIQLTKPQEKAEDSKAWFIWKIWKSRRNPQISKILFVSNTGTNTGQNQYKTKKRCTQIQSIMISRQGKETNPLTFFTWHLTS